MKGILFKPEMIQAIIGRRKTQTRRVIKPQPPDGYHSPIHILDGAYGFQKPSQGHPPFLARPPYRAGETVYIKEAYCPECYKIDGIEDACYRIDEDDLESTPTPIDCLQLKWESPLFMPQWAARYFIVILDVKAQRLQEITNEDIVAEGVLRGEFKCNPGFPNAVAWRYHDGGEYWGQSGVPVFQRLWDSVNPKYPFDSNPWVFVYEFKATLGDRRDK